MAMKIEEAASAFVEKMAQSGLKQQTLAVYERDLAKLVDFFGDGKDLEVITLNRINGFVKSNRLLKNAAGKALAPPTINRTKLVCRKFLQWLVGEGHLGDLPAGVFAVLKGQGAGRKAAQ